MVNFLRNVYSRCATYLKMFHIGYKMYITNHMYKPSIEKEK